MAQEHFAEVACPYRTVFLCENPYKYIPVGWPKASALSRLRAQWHVESKNRSSGRLNS